MAPSPHACIANSESLVSGMFPRGVQSDPCRREKWSEESEEHEEGQAECE